MNFKKYNHSKKFGLAMSIETMAVIMVIAIVLATVAVTTGYLYDLYETQQMAKELSTYREAFKKFKDEYGYDAGMVPDEALIGNINILGVSDAVTRANGMESFRQLAAADLIPKNLVNLKIIVDATNGNTNPIGNSTATQIYIKPDDVNKGYANITELVYGNLYPKTGWNVDLHYDANTYSSGGVWSGVGGMLYNDFHNISLNGGSAAQLNLHGAGVYCGFRTNFYRTMAILNKYPYKNPTVLPPKFDQFPFSDNVDTCYNKTTAAACTTAALKRQIASLSSLQTQRLDTKIDDGHPGLGWIMADNVSTLDATATAKVIGVDGATCVGNGGSLGGAGLTADGTIDSTTICANFQNISYIGGSQSTPDLGCIVYIDITSDK